MNVSFNPENELTATLKVTLEPGDYQPAVEKELKKYQQKVNIPGFRPGKAPLGLVKRSVGKSILVDEVNRLASNGMFGYLRDNKIDILAQPLLSEKTKSEIDFENEGAFVFAFEVALAPKFEINISSKDEVTAYEIEITDKMIDDEVENIARRHGITVPVEAAELKDVIYAETTELDENGTPLDGGVSAKPISLTAELIKDEELQKQFIGVKKGDVVKADIRKLFNENETVISHTLGIAKEGVADLNPTFELKVTEVQRFEPAQINQDLWNRIFGEGVVNSEEEFRQRLKTDIELYYKQESDQFVEHTLNHLVGDKHQFTLPDEFLKRWLVESKPEEYNEQNIDERYAKEAGSLRYILVQEKIIEKYNIEVSKEDMEMSSLGYTANLFRQYGIQNPDFNTVKEFSDKSLKQEKYQQTVRDIATRKKVIDKLKEIVTLVPKRITMEDFYDMIREHNKTHGHDHE